MLSGAIISIGLEINDFNFTAHSLVHALVISPKARGELSDSGVKALVDCTNIFIIDVDLSGIQL